MLLFIPLFLFPLSFLFNNLLSMAETQEDRKKRDEQIRETIMAKLVETGEKDRYVASPNSLISIVHHVIL